ncbi:hypothetical protein DV738_g1438, partial [Chaetothyriales sp. CBS 135597]
MDGFAILDSGRSHLLTLSTILMLIHPRKSTLKVVHLILIHLRKSTLKVVHLILIHLRKSTLKVAHLILIQHDHRTAIDNSRIGQPRSTHAVEASHAHSTGSCSSAAAILEEKKPETGIQTSGSLSQVKVASTQESSPVAAKPLSSAYRRSQTPSSRPRKKAKLALETDLGKEETEFVLYLSLQNIQPQAIAIELGRISQQFNNLGWNFDDKAGLLGHRVVKWLKTFQQSKKTEEEAERIVADLLAQGENQGWSTGPLCRARDYSKSLAEGKVPSQTRKIRQEEARCRQALKKWRINNPDELPRPGMRTALERRAYDGMMMEATQKLAGPNKELMKRNLINASLDPPDQKIQVRFHAVGGAPQLKQKVFKISASSRTPA